MRLAGQEKLGYYPTPLSLIWRIQESGCEIRNRRAEDRRDKEFARKGKRINGKALLLERIGSVILNEKVTDAEVRRTVYQCIPPGEL